MISNVVLPSETCTVLGVIDPDATAASTVTGDWCSLIDFGAVIAYGCLPDSPMTNKEVSFYSVTPLTSGVNTIPMQVE